MPADRDAGGAALLTMRPRPAAPDAGEQSVFARPWLRYVAMLLPVLLAAIAFVPITQNYFYADDFQHFYELHNDSAFGFITTPHAGHLYLTRNSVWYLLDGLFGTEPQPYFWFVLATHLVNVWLLFRVIERFTRSVRLACLGATLWGLAPANEGSLGWFCVYGHVLAATWLLILLDQLGRRADGAPTSRLALVGAALLLLAMSTSFGIGIGFALAFPVAAWLLLPPSRDRKRLVLVSGAVAALLPFIYIGLHRMHPSRYGGANSLTGLLRQTSRTGADALTLYFHLVVSGVSDLLSGPAFDRNHYPTPDAYAVAVGFLIALIAALWIGSGAMRRRLLACIVLVLAGYAMIAVGRGQTLAGGIQALYAPRYHYAVPAVIALLSCVVLAALDSRRWLRLPAGIKDALTAGAIVAMASAHVLLAPPIDHRRPAGRETARVVGAIRARIEATPPHGVVYIRNDDFEPIGPMRIPSLFPGWAAVFVIYFPDNTVDGRRVYFVDDRAGVRLRALYGSRSVDLFVTSDQVLGPADE